MKKLYFLIVLIISVLVLSCSNSSGGDEPEPQKKQKTQQTTCAWNEDNISLINNATDNEILQSVQKGTYFDPYERIEGTTGIIGKWQNKNSNALHIWTIDEQGVSTMYSEYYHPN